MRLASVLCTVAIPSSLVGSRVLPRIESHRDTWPRLGALCGAGFAVLGGVLLAPWRLGVVSGHSMDPTMPNGGVFMYERVSPGAVRPGEIVVALVGGVPCVKRVYATGGSLFWTLRAPFVGHIRRDLIPASQVSRFKAFAAHERSVMHADVRVARFRVPAHHVFLVGDGATCQQALKTEPVSGVKN